MREETDEGTDRGGGVLRGKRKEKKRGRGRNYERRVRERGKLLLEEVKKKKERGW